MNTKRRITVSYHENKHIAVQKTVVFIDMMEATISSSCFDFASPIRTIKVITEEKRNQVSAGVD